MYTNSRAKRIINILLVIVIFSLALFFRLYHLDKYTLWYDEASFIFDERGLNQLFPVYKLLENHNYAKHQDYLLLYNHGFIYYWKILFGQSEFVLRISSVMFGILSIVIIYILAKKFFSIQVAQVASFFLAISPLHIHYSQELRPYAATCFFTLIAAYFFLKTFNNDSKKNWIIFVIAIVLNCYFLYINLIILSGFWVFFILKVKEKKQVLRPWIIANLAIFVLILPVLFNLLPYFNLIFGDRLSTSLIDLPLLAKNKIGIMNLLFTLKNFSIGYNINYYTLVGKLSTLFCSFFLVIGFLKFRKNIFLQFFLTCLLIPVIVLFVISKFSSCYVDRWFFPLLSFYFLCVSVGLFSTNRNFAYTFIFSLTILNIYGLKNYYSNFLPADYNQHVGVFEKQNIKDIAKELFKEYRKGDRVVHVCRNTVFPIKFYIRQAGFNANLLGEIDKGSVILNDAKASDSVLSVVNYKNYHPVPFLLKDDLKEERLVDCDRLWVVFSDWYFRGESTNKYEIIQRLQLSFRQEKVKKSQGAYLYLFSPRM